MRTTCLVVVALMMAAGVRGQSPAAHRSGVDRLARMAGRWTIEERYAGDSKVYRKISTCELFQGGHHLVCRSSADTPLGPSTSLGILSFDPADGSFTQYTIASAGIAAIVRGTVTDTAWVGQTDFPFTGERIRATVTLTDESPAAWIYKLEGSIGGSPLITLLSAVGKKE